MPWWKNIDWGDIPTALATLFAAGAVALAWHTYRNDRRDRFQSAHRAQADRVAAWFIPDGFSVFDHYDSAGVALRNASDLPVYNVRLEIFRWVHMGDIDHDEGTESIFETLKEPFVVSVGTLGPSDQVMYIPWPRPAKPTEWSGDQSVSPDSELYLVFRDAAGAQWVRHPDGVLHEGSRPWPTQLDSPFGIWEDYRWQYGLPAAPPPDAPKGTPAA